MSAPGSSRLSSPPSFSKDDSHTILHRMPRNGNPRDLFSCLFGALPFSPAAISLYLPVYSCQARPLLIIYGIIIPDDCQCLCFLPVKSEKSSNKCKTLLAKHHFIILHNSVCALLVNLHRLPLFSFCSLLILLYLCQSCQFFLEQFAGGFPSEHLPWVVVNPVLYPLDIVLCPVIEVFSLRYLPAYQSVLVLVAATLK